MFLSNLLIVGLGNPGKEYKRTRHNIGANFVQLLSSYLDISMEKEKKFSSLYGNKQEPEIKVHLSIPSVFMNESGQAVAKIKKYLKLSAEEILIVHDELDLPTGKLKLKESGGDGGHKGIRSVIDHLQGVTSFKRLRIGISHPGKEKDVTNYVLSKASGTEREILERSMQNALPIIDKIIQGEWQQAIMALHTEEDN
tara:strand:- start:682 stop:1272 length:591 start_codon:yes stop_codon:yes gene_type:complete